MTSAAKRQLTRYLYESTTAGAGSLPSAFAVSDLAAASVASAAGAVAALIAKAHGEQPAVSVDRRLASLWFRSSIDPIGWKLPGLWDSIAGDYACRDGWIRLHTNAPLHRAVAQKVFGAHDDRTTMAAEVAQWNKHDLERAWRRAIAPALIDISLNAYGWSGPWATQRGFDSRVQMSTGIAHSGMQWRDARVPTPLPAQALDHATGYLMAWCTGARSLGADAPDWANAHAP